MIASAVLTSIWYRHVILIRAIDHRCTKWVSPPISVSGSTIESKVSMCSPSSLGKFRPLHRTFHAWEVKIYIMHTMEKKDANRLLSTTSRMLLVFGVTLIAANAKQVDDFAFIASFSRARAIRCLMFMCLAESAKLLPTIQYHS